MSGSAPATGDVATTVRGMWASRPPRRRSDGRIAGVAGAVARRYAVDPTLVRVAFVVLALTGGGLLLYVAGWVVLPPDPADPPHRGPRGHRDHRGHRGPGDPRPARQGPPPALVVAGVLVALATLGPAVGGRLETLVGLAVAAVLLYSLHTARAHLGEPGGTPATPTATPTGTGGSHGEGRVSLDKTTRGPTGPDGPPAWDPLGAAPFAWDLPEPAPPTEPRRRRLVTPVTLALARVAAGAVGMATLAGVPGTSVTTVAAAALAVVGVGLLVGGLRGHGRGLVVAAVPLVLLTVLAATAGARPDGPDPFGGGIAGGIGDVTAAPATAALVAPAYRSGAGDVDVDLRAVVSTPAGPVRTSVSSGAGDVTVTVPATADVTLACRSGLGDVDCLGSGDGTLVDAGSDGPGGPRLDLTVTAGAGDVAVRRG